jgi:hypothetical protein
MEKIEKHRGFHHNAADSEAGINNRLLFQTGFEWALDHE